VNGILPDMETILSDLPNSYEKYESNNNSYFHLDKYKLNKLPESVIEHAKTETFLRMKYACYKHQNNLILFIKII
jgi:hypothetical protein